MACVLACCSSSWLRRLRTSADVLLESRSLSSSSLALYTCTDTLYSVMLLTIWPASLMYCTQYLQKCFELVDLSLELLLHLWVSQFVLVLSQLSLHLSPSLQTCTQTSMRVGYSHASTRAHSTSTRAHSTSTRVYSTSTRAHSTSTCAYSTSTCAYSTSTCVYLTLTACCFSSWSSSI